MSDKKNSRHTQFLIFLLKNVSTILQKIAICKETDSFSTFWLFLLKSMAV